MKNALLTGICLLSFNFLFSQNIGIGTISPDSSAALDVSGSDKGLLIPRVALGSTTDITTIINPATGLQVYNTATSGNAPYNVIPGLYMYSGSAWLRISNAGTKVGEILYWNGSQWLPVPAGLPGQFLQLNSSSIPSWTGNAFPTISTKSVTAVTDTTASSGGYVILDGGTAVTARGIVWGTSPNPTIALTTKTSDGADTGTYTSLITGLAPATIYYLRAYATNGGGTGYGNQISFATSGTGSTIIQSVAICSQVWMTQNLAITTYRNGDAIPQVADPTDWENLNTGAWCYYNNDTTNETIYGKMYNWYAVTDPRGLAPLGWHLPTDEEYTTLSSCLGGDAVAGGKMKAVSPLWLSPNTTATDQSSFGGLPGGYRGFAGDFGLMGASGYWWSSTSFDSSLSWRRTLAFDNGALGRLSKDKRYGYSVRCIRD